MENTGSRAGEEVVQLYVKLPAKGAPIRSLAGFQRVPLGPKERKTVQFTLQPRQMALVDARGGAAWNRANWKSPWAASKRAASPQKLRVSGSAKEIDQ